jgi:hypothetical protein
MEAAWNSNGERAGLMDRSGESGRGLEGQDGPHRASDHKDPADMSNDVETAANRPENVSQSAKPLEHAPSRLKRTDLN